MEEKRHTLAMLGRIESRLEQLRNVANIGRHGELFRVGYEGRVCGDK